MNMYRYVAIISVHGESTISIFTKFFKIHFKTFGDEICIYMYICVTCNSDTRALDQFCNKHVRFKQVIIHRILCVTLREQLHSRLSGDKKKKDAMFINQQITIQLTINIVWRFFFTWVRCPMPQLTAMFFLQILISGWLHGEKNKLY